MNKKLYLCLLLLMLAQLSAGAQEKNDQRTQTTRIADLLAQLPARDQTQFNTNMNEIAALGASGYTNLIAMLSTAKPGTDAPVAYAISGFSAAATAPGNTAWREMSVKAYQSALPTLTDTRHQAFIISQLALVGENDVVPVLTPYLNHAELADPAARALVKINTVAAKNALLSALPSAKGKNRLTMIEALGDSRFKAATPVLTPIASGGDQEEVKSALYALASIGDPASAATMTAAAEKNAYQYENTNAVQAYLRYLKQLLDDDQRELAGKLAKDILSKTNTAALVHVRTAALDILTRADQKKNISYLLEATKDPQLAYRVAALKFALPDINTFTAPVWLDWLGKSDATSRAEIIRMLGESRVAEVLPELLKRLSDPDQQVRLAAIDAVAKTGGEKVLDDLLKQLPKGNEQEVHAISNALRILKGPSVTEKIAAVLPRMKANVQIALIDVLASRAANAQLASVYALQKSKDKAVSSAAFAALSHMVQRKDLPSLFPLLLQTKDQANAFQVRAAVIAALNPSAGQDQDVSLVLKQMEAAPVQKQYLFDLILAKLGGNQALETVAGAYQRGDAERQQSALAALANWKDAAAAETLFRIASTASAEEIQDQAIIGYLNLVRNADYPGAQKLLLLRKAMAITKRTALQQQILKDTEQCKTFNALVFAGSYLDHPALQQAAANTVMRIALTDHAFEGKVVKELLTKTMELLKGGDSDYERQAILKYLGEMKDVTGFVQVFNGRDLSGWKGLVGDPLKRAKLDAGTLAAAQEKADAEALKSWVIDHGDLLFTGKGDNLVTDKKYGDVEMLVDWKIYDDGNKKGDAGIYLRGSPQVQIWDTSRVESGAQVGSGGLYNNQVNESKPLRVADNKLGEWNNFRIIMKGDRVTVYLNGVLVTDDVVLENYWDRKLPIFPEEQIELQAHGSRVAYRDIYIRELPRPKPFELSESEKKAGYQILFDGTNMHQWTGNLAGYTIEDGIMTIDPKPGKGSGGNLFTKAEYEDFVFRFEFKLTPGANNGLGIRAPLEGDAAYEGMELQILDNEAPIYKDLHDYQYHGSIYGVSAAKRGFLKPVGEWNQEEVVVKGDKIKVWLNGTLITDADISGPRAKGTADGKPHPGLQRKGGHIGFLGHGSVVQFRNIRIKNLSKTK